MCDDLAGAIRDYLAPLGEPVPSFLDAVSWNMPARRLDARNLNVTSQLARCAELASGHGKPLAQLLVSCRDRLYWGQTYGAGDFGPDFLDRYGWVEIFGTRGHFVHDSIAAGFLMLGPNVVYPDHHHVAEEIYVPLTGGTAWRKGGEDFDVKEADAVIHHPSNVSHAMRTGAEPLLALYVWRGGPLAQKSVIGKTVPRGAGR